MTTRSVTEIEERIIKLPAWARDHIKNLQRERDAAVDTLSRFEDSQTPSEIYYEQMPSDGRKVGPSYSRRYINGASHGVTFEAHGVELTVRTQDEGSRGQPCIALSWCKPDQITSQVAMVPTHFNSVCLVSQENLQ